MNMNPTKNSTRSEYPNGSQDRRCGLTAALVIAAVLFFSGGMVGLHAQSNPLLGVWEMNMVFVPESVEFEFRSNGIYMVTSGMGEVSEYDYYLAGDSSTVTMQMDEESVMDWKYEFPGGDRSVLRLYLIEEGNEWFFDEFINGMMNLQDVYINDITENFYENIREAITDVFVEEPFLEGRRIQ
jgi:hypothetical protein